MTKKLFVVLVVITAMLISFSLVIAAKKAPFRGTPQPYEKQTVAQQSAIPLPVSNLSAPITPEPFSTSSQAADRVIGTWPSLSAAPGDILWCCPLAEATEDQFLGVESLRDTLYVTGAGGTTSPDPNYVYAFLHAGGDVCTFLYKHAQPTSSSWGWRDIACDGEYLYASDSYTLECFYMTPSALVPVPANNIGGPISPCRAVAYDAGRDWFWTASFSSDIYGFDRSGTVQAQYPNSYPLYGMAYDGVYLWCHSQDNTKAYQFDVNSGTYTGVVYSGCDDAAGGIAGGLSILDVDEGKQTMTLVGVSQSAPDVMYAMEIEISGGPVGCCDLPAGGCDMLTEEDCNTAGGTWNASPYDCIDNTCQLPVDSVCHLQWDNGSAAWYASSFAGGDEQGNYFDPETMCPDCGPNVYPFLVTQVSGLFYDFAGVGPVDVIVHFYSVGPDTCSGPGAEIYSFGATVSTYYPDEQFIPLPEVLCLEEDFIVTVELSGTEGSTPCLLWSSEAFQNCVGWIWHHTYGAPPWLAMEDLWAGGGYHMLRVDGICNSGACAQGVECYMFQGTGSAASYFSSWGSRDEVAKYYDPELHCTPPVYPVKISDVDVALYDYGGMGTVDVQVAIYVECSEPCDGPGTEIYRSDPITVTTFYPNLATLTLPDLVCIYEPFFVAIAYPSAVPGSTPSVLFDNGVCDTCHAWMWYPSGGESPPWIEWSDFWSPPPPGCPMIYVMGYTEDPACDIPPCDTTLEWLSGGQFPAYYWKQPPLEEFLNMRFQMPADHGGRLECLDVGFYAAGSFGTPDPDFYVWLSDGMFPLDNNAPYQAIADFHISYDDVVWYPGYNGVQTYQHNLIFDPGEMFHIGVSHAFEPGDTLAHLSDDGSFLSDRASAWDGSAWVSYYPYEFKIFAGICPIPWQSTFTMQCTPALGYATPGDVTSLYEVELTSVIGYTLNVTLSLLAVNPPENITASFSPNGVPCPYTSDVTVTIGGGVPYGLYTLTFQAVGTDGQTKTCDVNLEVQPPYDEALVEFFHGMQRTSNFGAIGNGNQSQNFVWYGTNYLYDGTIISAVPGDPQEDHMALDVYDCEHVGFAPTRHLIKTDDPWCVGSAYEEFYGEVAYSNFYVEEPIISCEWDSLFVIGLKHIDCTDFSIKIKIYYNPTPDSIPQLWAGVFEDWDVGDYGNNWGEMDVPHNNMWMYDMADPSLVFGIMKCPFYPEPMTSMVFVHNPTEVYPDGDSSFVCGNTPGLGYLYRLMTGGHRPPGYWSPDPDDYSTLIVGPPFSLNPAEKHIEIWIDYGRNLNDGLTWEQWYRRILKYVGFYRGDSNNDFVLDLADIVYLQVYLYSDYASPIPFADQADVDAKGPYGSFACDRLNPACPKDNVTASDVVYLINYIWRGGPPPLDRVRFIEQCWTRPSLFQNPNW